MEVIVLFVFDFLGKCLYLLEWRRARNGLTSLRRTDIDDPGDMRIMRREFPNIHCICRSEEKQVIQRMKAILLNAISYAEYELRSMRHFRS